MSRMASLSGVLLLLGESDAFSNSCLSESYPQTRDQLFQNDREAKEISKLNRKSETLPPLSLSGTAGSAYLHL